MELQGFCDEDDGGATGWAENYFEAAAGGDDEGRRLVVKGWIGVSALCLYNFF